MSGAGDSGAGGAPYGIGTPTTTSGREGLVFTGEDGAQYGSPWIDPQTRQYVFDTNGRRKGMPNVRHLVETVALTLKDSSSLRGYGMPGPAGTIDSNFVARREVEIRQAFKTLVDSKIIEIVAIKIEVKGSRSNEQMQWRDVDSGEVSELRFQ